jgi:hypothetical protein
MEKHQYDLHQCHKSLIKLTGFLLEADTALKKAFKHSRYSRWFNVEAKSIEQNIDTLIKGISETIRFAGRVDDLIKSEMENPNAILPNNRADGRHLTKLQRILANEGYIKTFGDLDPQLPKSIERIPKPVRLSFTTTKRKQKRRDSTPDNPPL